MATLHDVFATVNMLSVIEAVKNGVPNPFDPAFLTTTAPVEGDYGLYTKVEGTRKLAQTVQFGSKSIRARQQGVSDVPVKLIHTFMNQNFKQAVMLNLLSPDGSRQRMGEQEVGRQTGLLKTQFSNLRITALASGLALGHIYFDADGNLLSSSTGATVDVDYGIPAGNKNQLNVFGEGNIIAADWDTAGTSIVTQVAELKSAAIKLTGYPLDTAYYGSNIAGYLLDNDDLVNWAARVPGLNQTLATGVIPDGLLGINKWRPAQDHVFADADGDLQTIWDDDGITFIPAVSADWYEMLEGTFPIPTGIGAITAEAMQQLTSSIMEARGMFTYASIAGVDPVAITQYAGDTMLPVIKVPKAVFQAIVSGF
jgi:hypothetical protein